MTRSNRALALALPFILITAQANAHPGHATGSGLTAGFLHPLLGLDHVVAMLAVGLWAVSLGRAAAWTLPAVFPVVMALGAALGFAGLPLPAVEAGIALSGVVLGLLVAMAVRAPLWMAAGIVAAFAVFHGHAHGTELPADMTPYGYAAGFVAGTALLHLAGIGLGLLIRSDTGRLALRGAGGAIALAGAAFLFGVA